MSNEIESPWIEREPFDCAVVSWSDRGEELNLRVRRDGKISPRFSLGRMGVGSVMNEVHEGISVEVDIVRISPPMANAFQYRLSGSSSSAKVVTYRRHDRKPFSTDRSAGWGKVLPVPQRSQMVEAPEMRGRICSPTSVAMVLESFGVNLSTAEVCKGVYDAGSKTYGNWSFNTAFACQVLCVKNIESFVGRFSSLQELEGEIAEDRPVVISLRWNKGELGDAPVLSSDGHLLVVVGFTDQGDVVVNDPAANLTRGQSVRRTYSRRDIYKCWLENAEGIVYLFQRQT
jgi:uncharacterized protein YvpB